MEQWEFEQQENFHLLFSIKRISFFFFSSYMIIFLPLNCTHAYIIHKKIREISSEMHFWCKWKTHKQTKNSKVEVALAMRQMQMCENVIEPPSLCLTHRKWHVMEINSVLLFLLLQLLLFVRLLLHFRKTLNQTNWHRKIHSKPHDENMFTWRHCFGHFRSYSSASFVLSFGCFVFLFGALLFSNNFYFILSALVWGFMLVYQTHPNTRCCDCNFGVFCSFDTIGCAHNSQPESSWLTTRDSKLR